MYLVFGQDPTDDATAPAANTSEKLNAEYLTKLYSAKEGFTIFDKSRILSPAIKKMTAMNKLEFEDMNPGFNKRKD